MKNPLESCPLFHGKKDHPACKNCRARLLYAEAYSLAEEDQAKAMKKVTAAVPTRSEIEAIYKKHMQIPSVIIPDAFKTEIKLTPRKPGPDFTICIWPECDRLGDYALGYCQRCYLRYKRQRPIGCEGVKECKTKGCTEPGNYCLGLCLTCYSRRRSGKARGGLK